ncbi:MAG: Trm112 family protein [Candidatus Hydrothermae bacterium]|nr:Trm112 family protein [Candidatus Hydrothermae bacterium]
MAISKRLLEIIVCPICKGDLKYVKEEDVLVCCNCKLKYPIEEDIPVLLPEEAVKIDKDSDICNSPE